MTIDKLVVKTKVIGKREGTSGLIFKKPEYFVVFQMVDERFQTNPTKEREVPFEQYCTYNVGDILNVSMYSPDQKMWFYSEIEAELYERQGF